jgi:hypothetical protein
MWTGDFLIADLLAHCEISQFKELDVGIISIITLHVSLSATQSFREHPSKQQHVREKPMIRPNVVWVR